MTERRYVLLPDGVLRALLQLLVEFERVAGAVGRQVDAHWSDGAEKLRGAIAGLKSPTKDEAALRAACAADEDAYRERRRQEQLAAERRADERHLASLKATSELAHAHERALAAARAIAPRLVRKGQAVVRSVKRRRA